MEALFVDGIDRHLRAAKHSRIVERADLDHDGWESLRQGRDVGAAFRAELARDRPFEIGASELLGRSLGVGESCFWHRHEHIRRSASDVLAFPAMALGFHHGVTFSDVAQRMTITTAFQFHKILQFYPQMWLAQPQIAEP